MGVEGEILSPVLALPIMVQCPKNALAALQYGKKDAKSSRKNAWEAAVSNSEHVLNVLSFLLHHVTGVVLQQP